MNNCTVRDTIVVSLDDTSSVGFKRASGRQLQRSWARFPKKETTASKPTGKLGKKFSRNPSNSASKHGSGNGVWGKQALSSAGGIIGAAINSSISGAHNFGFTNDPNALIVSASFQYSKNPGAIAGGIVGVAYNSNLTQVTLPSF